MWLRQKKCLSRRDHLLSSATTFLAGTATRCCTVGGGTRFNFPGPGRGTSFSVGQASIPLDERPLMRLMIKFSGIQALTVCHSYVS